MLIRVIIACLVALAGAHYGITGFEGASIQSWWVGASTGILTQLIMCLHVEVRTTP